MLNGIFIDGIPVLLLPCFNPLSANPTTWLNTLKQFVGKLQTNGLSVYLTILYGWHLKG